MTPPSPSTVSLILGIATILAALVGHYLSRRGKQDEVKQQQVAQAFEERTNAYTQQKELATQYREEADRQRELRVKDNDAWEARWSRQMDRCRKVTDAASATVARLMSGSADRQEAQAILEDLAEHRDEDHG